MLSDEGNRFAVAYYEAIEGGYFEDYEEVLVGDLESLYHVQDNQQNFEKMKKRIDERFAELITATQDS